MAILVSTERRLMNNKDTMQLYAAQIKDMLERKVARKLSDQEIRDYGGPIYYLPHHEILKPESSSTPCRIVFNSSCKLRGHILNDYWAKGSSQINNLCGILVRFRERYVGAVADISKMYHAIKIGLLDQHTHRFLWRDFNEHCKPDTFVMTSVSFGDRPSGSISIMALKKTADMADSEYTQAREIIKNNSYVDDIIDSFDDDKSYSIITSQINKILLKGNFKIKEWISSASKGCKVDIEGLAYNKTRDYSNDSDDSHKDSSQKVLGVYWYPETDCFLFSVNLNLKCKRRSRQVNQSLKLHDIVNGLPMRLTKRLIFSWINGLFDPLGLIAPFIIRAKILMRQLWLGENKPLGWDDPITTTLQSLWHALFLDMFEVENIYFKRCIKPIDVSTERPVLLIFCDSSETAFGHVLM